MNLSTEIALFALGNFWEPAYQFSKLDGILGATVGYSGGTSSSPTYHNLDDHCETIQLEFDPRRISYKELLDMFWQLHDVTAEVQTRLRSAIFYFDEVQREAASQSRHIIQLHANAPILTEIVPAGRFYPAEEYNQNYIATLRNEL